MNLRRSLKRMAGVEPSTEDRPSVAGTQLRGYLRRGVRCLLLIVELVIIYTLTAIAIGSFAVLVIVGLAMLFGPPLDRWAAGGASCLIQVPDHFPGNNEGGAIDP
jgi:hypothetical protein